MSDSISLAADASRAVIDEEADERAPAWAAVVAMSLGVFGLVTAEFLPASVLTPMAADLGISEGVAGQAVTATAVIGAIAAPTMAIFTRTIDRRLVLWTLTLLLVVSSLLTATASGFASLLVARLILGVSLGGFWSMSAAMAMRLVPPRLLPRAMSLIFVGVSLATVCAAPVGAYASGLWGWRSAFVIATVAGMVALVAQMLTIPRLPPVSSTSFGSMFGVLRRPAVIAVLAAVLFIASGHFAGFTYIRLFLEQVPVLDVEAISLVLLAFGLGGFVGNLVGTFLVERSVRLALTLGASLVALSALSMIFFGTSVVASVAAITLWGTVFGWLPFSLQTWAVRAAPDQAEAMGGLLVAAFQVAIAGGAIFGGLLVESFGALGAPGYSVVAMALGALLVFTFGNKGLPRQA